MAKFNVGDRVYVRGDALLIGEGLNNHRKKFDGIIGTVQHPRGWMDFNQVLVKFDDTIEDLGCYALLFYDTSLVKLEEAAKVSKSILEEYKKNVYEVAKAAKEQHKWCDESFVEVLEELGLKEMWEEERDPYAVGSVLLVPTTSTNQPYRWIKEEDGWHNIRKTEEASWKLDTIKTYLRSLDLTQYSVLDGEKKKTYEISEEEKKDDL